MKYLLNATIGKKKLRKKILRKLNNGNIDSIRSLNIFIERLHQFVGSGFSARSGRLRPSNRSVARRLGLPTMVAAARRRLMQISMRIQLDYEVKLLYEIRE